MKVLNDKHVVFFDVDDTLIIHRGLEGNIPDNYEHPDLVEFNDPYHPDKAHKVRVLKHRLHCLMLKRMPLRDKKVYVWSHSGVEYAEAAIKALGLEKYVTAIIPKPETICDDKNMEDWGVSNIFQGNPENVL